MQARDQPLDVAVAVGLLGPAEGDDARAVVGGVSQGGAGEQARDPIARWFAGCAAEGLAS